MTFSAAGIQPVPVVLRALALSQLHQGKPTSDVADGVRFSARIIAMVCAGPHLPKM
jgi:hypothetical protein